VNSYLQIQTTDANGWLLKAKIAERLTTDPSGQGLITDINQASFQALEKALILDRQMVTDSLAVDRYTLPYNIYNNYSNKAIAIYNAGAEKGSATTYKEALSNFKKAINVARFINTNGWGLSALDTNNVIYAAKAAIFSNTEADAITYSKRIIDSKLISAEVKPLYQWIAYYYVNQKNAQQIEKYTGIGKDAYPGDAFFYLNYIDYIRTKGDFETLQSKYDELFNKGFNEPISRLAYLNDLQRELAKPVVKERSRLSAIFLSNIQSYNSANSTDVNGRMLLAIYYINEAGKLKQIRLKKSMEQVRKYLILANMELKIVLENRDAGDVVKAKALGLWSANSKALGK